MPPPWTPLCYTMATDSLPQRKVGEKQLQGLCWKTAYSPNSVMETGCHLEEKRL